MERASGILLPLFSLPSPYGIGTMGRAAYEFADFLHAAGQRYWQLLPLGPTGYGDSPYQSFSTYAGNPYFIDLELLAEDGLLTQAELSAREWGNDPRRVDYGAVYENRLPLLRLAKARGWQRDRDAVAAFAAQNAAWLPDYALFMALKERFGMKPWQQWPEDIRLRRPEALKRCRAEAQEEIEFYTYVQFLFFRQWNALKAYVNGLGIRIIGDVPIYVAMDSADVWAERAMFQLDSHGFPTEVAGVPPDYFSADGQLWGNPLYDYEAMKHDGFGWWIRRIDGAARLYDVVRIDHFRGFAAYWAVPHGETTAKNGHWMPGPGMDLVGVLTGWFPNLSFIAEDLGTPAPEVTALLSVSGLPGMRVLEFAFDNPQGQSPYLPHRCIENCVYYTGTHDNAPLSTWRSEAEPEALTFAAQYLGLNPQEGFCAGMLRSGMMTSAKLFVSQLQDWLEPEDVGRINTPGTAQGNWQFRLSPGVLSDELAAHIRAVTARYGRLHDCAALKAVSSQPMPHL